MKASMPGKDTCSDADERAIGPFYLPESGAQTLARSPEMPGKTFARATEIARGNGLESEQLERTTPSKREPGAAR